MVGVSKDSQKSHCSFIEKQALTFPLLSDTDGKLCEAFGAWGEKVNYGKKYMGIIRSTAVIGADGKVLKVYPKVSVKGHVEQVLEDLQGGVRVDLGFGIWDLKIGYGEYGMVRGGCKYQPKVRLPRADVLPTFDIRHLTFDI